MSNDFLNFNEMLARAAHRWPERTFLFWTDKDRSLTYAQAYAEALRTAGALAALGVSHGDRVGIFAHNGLDYVTAMFGAWHLGAISCHINVLQADDVAYFANDATPKVLIYTHDMLPVLELNRSAMPSIEHYLCMDGAQPGARDWPALVADAPVPPVVSVNPEDGAHLSYTSGSSGTPKGALISHGSTARATQCIAERMRLCPEDVTLQPTSPASSMGLVANLLPGLHRGAAVGLMSRWTAPGAWDEMDRRGVTYAIGNPLLFTELLSECQARGRTPGRLSRLVSGGAPVPPQLKRDFLDLGVFLIESYGQSELGGFLALGYPEAEPDGRALAIGPALPDKDVRVLDEACAEAAPGEPGELCIRGGYMIGYWGRPEKTDEVLRDGWLHTGDMGVMDAWGYVSILGRWSERIVRDKEVLFPRAMEEALLKIPAVRYAAVIGQPDVERGELVKAVVTLQEGESSDSESLLQLCLAKLAGQPAPDRLEIIDEMPMTATGKIGRAVLQAREKSSA
ncbi:MAG: acyl--CoA ligase [Gammaproteobacteria bacterium]|nr:acyl--CoA ligase [Gammaproteobacteria bacterium]